MLISFEEAIFHYAKNDAYWLKLCQFGDEIDISVLNKLEKRHREEWKLFELEGLDKLFYYIQKFFNIPSDNRVFIKPMFFLGIFSSAVYCVLKPEVLDFFSNLSRLI